MEYQAVELGPGWWVMLLGWPAVAGAVVAFAWALMRQSRAAALVGLLLAAPMFVYLSLTPRLQLLAPGAWALLAIMFWRFNDLGTWARCLLTLPAAGILVWLAFSI